MDKQHFKVDISKPKLNICLNSSKYKNFEVNIIIKDIDSKLQLWNSIFFFKENTLFWYKPIKFEDHNGFIIQIFESENEIFNERIRLKNTRGVEIQKPYIFVGSVGGIGDHFSAEPTLRKISESFDQKLIIFSYFPELFINHPCIEQVIKVNGTHTDNDIVKNVPDEYKDKNIRYILRCERDRFGYLPYWDTIDLKQLSAIQAGITLKRDELDYHFYPDDFENIDLPDKYVVINPSITAPSRTWSLEKWQKLIDILNDNDINVVSIGKDVSGKSFYNDIIIKKGLNLCGDERQNSLSQVWHILNRSKMFITFDTGLFIFAGSTDTFILQIGGSIDPEYHKPYRNGTQNYKYSYVEGNCKIKCFSDPKYGIQWSAAFGNMTGKEKIGYCFKQFVPDNEYDCHPSPELVAEKALIYYK